MKIRIIKKGERYWYYIIEGIIPLNFINDINDYTGCVELTCGINLELDLLK